MALPTAKLLPLFICLMVLFKQTEQQSVYCRQYLTYLSTIYTTNHDQCIDSSFIFTVKSEMSPYLLFSGKGLDDLGYPGSCLNETNNYKYFTVELVFTPNDTTYTGYMGICFTDKCNVNDLNLVGGFIIDYLLEDYEYAFQSRFILPQMSQQFSALALSFSLMFLLFVIIGMLYPIQAWIQMCKSNNDEEQYAIKSVYINLDQPSSEYDEDQFLIDQPIIKRLSLRHKWQSIWKDQQSKKIYAFSVFRLVAVPLVVYGELYYEANKAAFNYLAFQDQLYTKFFSKVAMLTYYIPDIFFMISGFLFCKKMISINVTDENIYLEVMKNVLFRICRLYPIYISMLLIYWCITPALHHGPVWFVYEQQASVCDAAWWRVFLMIDNWWQVGCYPMLWYVQVQAQFTLFMSIFYIIYHTHNQASYYYFGTILLTAWVLLFVFSAQLPATLQIILNDYSSLYFRSFYSHLGFYLWGTLLALLANITSLRIAIQQKVLENSSFMIATTLFTTGLFIIILIQPSLWIGTYASLSIQLSLCRVGMLIIFTILFTNGIFQQSRSPHHTVIHKYGYYVYPIILCSYFVMQSSFWEVSSFFYIDAINLLNNSIPIIFVSIFTGILLGLVMDLRGLVILKK